MCETARGFCHKGWMAFCVSFLAAWCACVFSRVCWTPCVSIAGLVVRGGRCKYYLRPTKQKHRQNVRKQTKRCTRTVEDTPSVSFHAGDWSNPGARIVASVTILNSFQAVVPPVLKRIIIIHVYCAHHHGSTALLLLGLSSARPRLCQQMSR